MKVKKNKSKKVTFFADDEKLIIRKARGEQILILNKNDKILCSLPEKYYVHKHPVKSETLLISEKANLKNENEGLAISLNNVIRLDNVNITEIEPISFDLFFKKMADFNTRMYSYCKDYGDDYDFRSSLDSLFDTEYMEEFFVNNADDCNVYLGSSGKDKCKEYIKDSGDLTFNAKEYFFYKKDGFASNLVSFSIWDYTVNYKKDSIYYFKKEIGMCVVTHLYNLGIKRSFFNNSKYFLKEIFYPEKNLTFEKVLKIVKDNDTLRANNVFGSSVYKYEVVYLTFNLVNTYIEIDGKKLMKKQQIKFGELEFIRDGVDMGFSNAFASILPKNVKNKVYKYSITGDLLEIIYTADDNVN